MVSKINWFWVSTLVVLVVISLLAGILAWSRYDRGSLVELSLDQGQEAGGTIYLGDGVVLPGFYPFTSDDTITDLLQAAGGVKNDADLNNLTLYAASSGTTNEPQKVDINRAGTWLLQALPGVGEILAQRIIDYRQQNGPFRNPAELTKVSGIGNDTYNKVKDLITVNGY